MKKLGLPLMLGFGVALAIIVGQRMSTDAMAVVIGVAVGVAASVPTSLLLVALLRRERQTWRSEMGREQPSSPQLPPPNLIVLNPNDFAASRDPYQHMPLPPPDRSLDGGMRRLKVVGDDDDWS